MLDDSVFGRFEVVGFGQVFTRVFCILEQKQV